MVSEGRPALAAAVAAPIRRLYTCVVLGWVVATLLHQGLEGGAEALGHKWPPVSKMEEGR